MHNNNDGRYYLTGMTLPISVQKIKQLGMGLNPQLMLKTIWLILMKISLSMKKLEMTVTQLQSLKRKNINSYAPSSKSRGGSIGALISVGLICVHLLESMCKLEGKRWTLGSYMIRFPWSLILMKIKIRSLRSSFRE